MGAEHGVAVAFEDEVAAGVEARVRFAVGVGVGVAVAVGVAVGIAAGVRDHGFTSFFSFVCSTFWLIRSYAFCFFVS
jgi:high-affinity Fe2+/Pb2+ permease